ncbi:mRNA splicing protein prp28, partial [Ascosphaera atra]
MRRREESTQSSSKASQRDDKEKEGKKLSPEEAEAQLVKQRYMGQDLKSNFSAKKKRKRTAEKKFNFEWNADEDTSQDYNPLYNERADINFYGRGRLAGFGDDVSEAMAK